VPSASGCRRPTAPSPNKPKAWTPDVDTFIPPDAAQVGTGKVLRIERRSVRQWSMQSTPNDAQLIKLAAEAVKNATSKQDAARRLLDAGGDPSTAFAVAALAMEELGKSFVCSTLLSQPPEVRTKAGPRMLADHRVKMTIAFAVIRVFVDETELPDNVDDVFDQIEKASATANDEKFRGLYVDAADDGASILTPGASEADARALVDLVGLAIDVLTAQGLTLDGTEDPALFRDLLDHLNHSPGRVVADQLIDADPMMALGQFRDAVRGQGSIPAWFLAVLPPDIEVS
jgi:AbiV family abortive infection protein